MKLCVPVILPLVFSLTCCHARLRPATREKTPAASTESYLDEEAALREGRQISARENRKSITQEQATTIANAYAKKSNRSVEALVPRACEQVRVWRIIYEEIGLEYVIDKTSGAVLIERKLWLEWSNRGNQANTPNNSSTFSKSDAIAVARRDFSELFKSYGSSPDHINEYTAFACELKNAWRVVFEYRQHPNQKTIELPNTNPPLYLIDKRTGAIIEREPPIR
jgi:Peptidase propeptide and YPEB domain